MRRILLAILLLPGLAYAQSAAQRLSQVGHVLNTGTPAASALGGTEIIPCIQGGTTSSCTPAQIKTYVGAATPGGSNTQLQYNNNGSLGGIASSGTSGKPLLDGGTGVTPSFGTLNLSFTTGTLGCAEMPALSGDTTSSAGSCATTVSKVNGASVPTTAAVLGSNNLGQLLGINSSGTSGLPLLDGGTGLSPSFGALSITGISATGTPSSTTYLRGDGTWSSPAGSGTVNTGTTGQLATYLTSTNAVSGLTITSNNLVGNIGSGAASLTPAQAIGVLNSASADGTCTTTTFTFVIGDSNGQVNCSNASAQTVTIPPNSSVNFAVGTLLTVQEIGAGVVTLSPGTGVTITSAAYGSSTSQTYSLGGQYGFIQIQQTATNTWNVIAWDTPANQKLAALTSERQAYLSASTAATFTGCTPSASSVGPFAGTWTQPATPCSTITITVNGATGFTDSLGYSGISGDETQTNAGTFIPSWIESASTSTTCTFKIPSAAQVASDVISFNCHPRSL